MRGALELLTKLVEPAEVLALLRRSVLPLLSLPRPKPGRGLQEAGLQHVGRLPARLRHLTLQGNPSRLYCGEIGRCDELFGVVNDFLETALLCLLGFQPLVSTLAVAARLLEAPTHHFTLGSLWLERRLPSPG